MNSRTLTTVLAATLALPLTAQGTSLFPERTNTPYGVPVRLGEQPVAPIAPQPETSACAEALQAEAPAPRAATLPMPFMPQERPRFSFDVRGFYGFRAVPHSVYATDMAGMETEFAWYVTPRQALTLGASFGMGGNDSVNYIHTPHGLSPVSEDFTRSDFNLMLGYRFTQMLTPRTSISFALKGGLDVQELSYDEFGGCWGWNCGCGHSYGETTCGFAYAASVTLVTQLTRRTMLQLGYQFRGATTEPDAPSIVPGGAPVPASSLRWHELHLGLRFLF